MVVHMTTLYAIVAQCAQQLGVLGCSAVRGVVCRLRLLRQSGRAPRGWCLRWAANRYTLPVCVCVCIIVCHQHAVTAMPSLHVSRWLRPCQYVYVCGMCRQSQPAAREVVRDACSLYADTPAPDICRSGCLVVTVLCVRVCVPNTQAQLVAWLDRNEPKAAAWKQATQDGQNVDWERVLVPTDDLSKQAMETQVGQSSRVMPAHSIQRLCSV